MKSEIVKKNSPVLHLLVSTSSLLPLPLMAQQINRTVLPVPETKPSTIAELDVRYAKPPPRFDVKARKGAIDVRIFDEREAAAKWLGVAVELLNFSPIGS